MKKFSWIMLICIAITACVDDYTDFNPAPQMDAPFLRISATGSNQIIQSVPINSWQSNLTAYMLYDEPVQFTVSVIDAPGKIGGVDVTNTVPDFGTITIDEASVNALIGKEQGDFKFTFTPNPDLTNKTASDRPLNLEVTVTDMQKNDKGEDSPKATRLTLPAVLAGPCLTEEIMPGNYLVVEATGNLDGGEAFTLEDLVAEAGSELVVAVTQDRPGLYTLNEITAGVWPLFYSGRANPALKVNLCNTTITGREGGNVAGAGTPAARTFTINGSLNEDDTITITWSYVRDDGTTPANPAKGTYKLKHFNML